ncbi:MAG: phosphatase PAP2 family protein [Bdellovibrionota bacterium]
MKRIVLAILLFVGFVSIAWLTQTHALLLRDQSLLETLSTFRSEGLLSVANVIVFPFNTYPSIVLAVVVLALCARIGKAESVARFLMLAVTLIILSKLEKYVFLRMRPTPSGESLYPGYSFPSAHMLRATALYLGALASLPPQLIQKKKSLWIGLGLALLLVLASAELLLQRNYPTDMLGGFLLGTAWVSLFSGLWDSKGHGEEIATHRSI